MQANLAIQTPEVKQLENETTSLLIQAKQFQVTNSEQYKVAGNELMRIKGVRKQVDDLFDPIVKKAHEAHKAAVAAKKQLTDPLDQAEKSIKSALLVYNQEQQQKAREEEERLRKIAEEQAAREREKLLKQAEKAIDKGNDTKAEELIEQADNVVPLTPIVTPQVQKVEGIATRKVWKARVVDEKMVPSYFNGIELRKIQQGQIDQLARMSSGTLDIPGIEFYEEVSLAARAI